MVDTIVDSLYEYQDKEYKDFTSRLIPNLDSEKFIGVRVPVLRSVTKNVMKDWEKTELFLASLPHEYYEENLLHSYIISYSKDVEFVFKEIDHFLPYIDNWAVCDSLNPKVLSKNCLDLDRLYSKILEWNLSDNEYTVRFAYVCLINNFVKENFDISHLDLPVKLCGRVVSEKYYVKMVIAWYLSMVLVRHFDEAVFILENSLLPVWVHNKTIQKAVESYQIPVARKEYLKSLRRKS